MVAAAAAIPSTYVARAQHTVEDAIVGPDFGAASFGLERYHAVAGTYDGAAITELRLRVAWGGESTYCLEGMSARHGVEHLLGPRGRVAPGPCPAPLR